VIDPLISGFGLASEVLLYGDFALGGEILGREALCGKP
jgi:hypothetical protein